MAENGVTQCGCVVCTAWSNIMFAAWSLDILSQRCSFAAIVFAWYVAKTMIVYEVGNWGSLLRYSPEENKPSAISPPSETMWFCDQRLGDSSHVAFFVDGFWLAWHFASVKSNQTKGERSVCQLFPLKTNLTTSFFFLSLFLFFKPCLSCAVC